MKVRFHCNFVETIQQKVADHKLLVLLSWSRSFNWSYGLFQLPELDSDSDSKPYGYVALFRMEICPENGYSSDWESVSESKSESDPVNGNKP